jgi:hypothetical protein
MGKQRLYQIIIIVIAFYGCRNNSIQVTEKEIIFPSGLNSFSVTKNTYCSYFYSHADSIIKHICVNQAILECPDRKVFTHINCGSRVIFSPLDTFQIVNYSNGDMKEEIVTFYFDNKGNVNIIKNK